MLHFESIPDPVRELLTALVRSRVVEGFLLGGGTSLALRLGHRISVDLDFFTVEPFEPDEVMGREGFPASHTVLSRSGGSLAVDCGGVKIDFLQHAYPLLEQPEVMEGISLLSLPDVIAMKLNAIANRGAKKDFFDIVRILEDQPLEFCLECFERKYRDTDRFVVVRSLAWFEDAEGEPDPVSTAGISWGEVKQRIKAAVGGLS